LFSIQRKRADSELSLSAQSIVPPEFNVVENVDARRFEKFERETWSVEFVFAIFGLLTFDSRTNVVSVPASSWTFTEPAWRPRHVTVNAPEAAALFAKH
jgi:hypothetical protein